ncbi:MAG: methyl-accepting chemotaxis protein [Desulfobacterales bacterium]|nr:MAG: methyl-accepting chemotaxis protein [Desulfobacterales bacterium]
MHKADASFLEVYLGTEWGGYASSAPAAMPKGYDPRKRGWYSETLHADKSRITPAYMTISTKTAVFSAVSPVKSPGGKVIGVAGIDISLAGMTNIVNDVKLGETGWVMFVDSTGTILANPADKSMNFKKIGEVESDAYKQLSRLVSGGVEIELDGKTYLALVYEAKRGDGGKLIGFIEKDEVMAKANSFIRVLVFVCLGLGVLFSFLGFFLANSIASPINKAVAMFRDIAEGEGDLTKRLEENSKDELGRMGYWFNIFVSNLQEMVKKISANAVNIDGNAKNLSGISKELFESSEDSSSRASNITTAAQEMSDNMNQVSKSMESSVSNTNMVASAVEEMSSTISEIAESAEKARVVSAQAVEQADAAAKSMGELGVAASKIGQVTQAITEISEQTNLLALNATIEAARAGEAGKGFAVVANEIKDLAKQTADATLDIKELIDDVQKTTDTTERDIERISEAIRGIDATVNPIAAAVEEQTATTREIAASINQMGDGVQEVNNTISESSAAALSITEDIKEMSLSSQSVTDNSREVDRNADEQLENSKELSDTVKKFIV